MVAVGCSNQKKVETRTGNHSVGSSGLIVCIYVCDCAVCYKSLFATTAINLEPRKSFKFLDQREIIIISMIKTVNYGNVWA